MGRAPVCCYLCGRLFATGHAARGSRHRLRLARRIALIRGVTISPSQARSILPVRRCLMSIPVDGIGVGGAMSEIIHNNLAANNRHQCLSVHQSVRIGLTGIKNVYRQDGDVCNLPYR